MPKYEIPDITNPDRGYCIIVGCCNLQRNHGNKRWGKYCDGHHNDPDFRAQRVAERNKHRVLIKAEKAARNIEYRRNIDKLRIFPRPCIICGKDKLGSEYKTILSTICVLCKKNQQKERSGRKRFSQYGMDRNDYKSLLASQNDCCAICGNKTKRVNIDHCHKTDTVRGLLCTCCNIGIGQFKDDLDLLASASSYLINSRCKKVI